MVNIGICGVGSYVPRSTVSNDEIEDRVGLDRGWIEARTGVKERRFAASEEATSDLAFEACQRALDNAGISASEVDVLILASGTFDQPGPASACFVQARLGAYNAASFDVAAACAGFLYGLTIARDMLMADATRRYAIVVGSEAYSRFLNFEDRSTCTLLGDGAGAAVLGRTDDRRIIASNIGTDGTLTQLGFIAAGGSRKPASVETLDSGQHFIVMKGGDIRRLIPNILPDLVDRVLRRADLCRSDVDLVVPHQANGVMLREWADLLGIDYSLVLQTVEKYGNTGAASIPLTLDDALCSDRVSSGSRILFVSFGAGISWGAVVVEWN